jgi:hypothetical protein
LTCNPDPDGTGYAVGQLSDCETEQNIIVDLKMIIEIALLNDMLALHISTCQGHTFCVHVGRVYVTTSSLPGLTMAIT